MNGIIYGLACPLTNEIHYVGQTIVCPTIRYNQHISSSLVEKATYTHKERWIRKLDKDNLRPSCIILEENLPLDTLNYAECFWMERFSNLTNSTSGGQDRYILSDDVINRLSESRKGHLNPNYGKSFTMSEEHKNKISQSMLNSKKFKDSRKCPKFKQGIRERQGRRWVVMDQNGSTVLETFSASEIAEYFGYTKGNILAARRNKRQIGKKSGTKGPLDNKYWVCFKDEKDEYLKL